MKALSKAPAERYPSVMAFSAALSEASTNTAPDAVASAAASAAVSAGRGETGRKEGGLFDKMMGLFGR
jgi:serine/threonine-protein kinase